MNMMMMMMMMMMKNSFGILRRVLTLPFLLRLSIPSGPFKVADNVLRALSFYLLRAI
jgi:hypothetical protein